jgi:hypothetical protein
VTLARALLTGVIWFLLPLLPYSFGRLADRLAQARPFQR